MKRILVITPFFYPHVGGSQQYMEDLYATLLQKHPDIRVDVLCYNTDHADSEEVYRGMHIYRIAGLSLLPGQFALPNPIKLLRFLKRKRHSYDLIHVSTRFFETAWWAPLYAKLTHTPIILTDHCAYHPVHQNAVVRFIARTMDVIVIPQILKLYNDIFVTNQATQAFLRHSLKTESKVLYGGVDTERFAPRHSGKLKAWPESDPGQARMTHERLTITYVGRMIDSKGVLQLFKIATRHPEYDFVFVGPGPLYESLQEVLTNDSYTHIQLLGSKKKEEVVEILSRSDIFVHPSYHHEGFPNSILEAGAMGLPVIATDVGGTKEIIIDGETGMLIPQKDPARNATSTGMPLAKPMADRPSVAGGERALEEAVMLLATHKGLREDLGKALRSHIEANFSWETIAEQHYNYLNESK